MLKVDIGFLIPGNTFSLNFVKSWTDTLTYLLERGYSFSYHISHMPVISSVRNHLFGKSPAKEYDTRGDSPTNLLDNHVICDKIILIDSDMIWQPEAIQQLIDSPYDITVAPYVLSDKKTSSVRIEEDFVSKEIIQKHKDPFPIHSAGLGFVSCKFDAIKKIPYPWFQTTEIIKEYENGERYGGTIGEDVYFFMKAKEHGIQAYCDPRIKVQHEKLAPLTI